MKTDEIKFCNLLLLVFFISFFSWGLVSCNYSKLPVGEGNIPVHDGMMWYKVSGTGTGIPVVLIHGGPGMNSYYLKPFEELGNDRQVIRYDQFGGGKSTFTKDTALFSLKERVLELETLREALGIKKWNILGHSLGTIIALEYFHAFPEHVASLIFASACLDIPAYAENAVLLLETLPDSLQNAVAAADSTGDYMNPLYQEAMAKFSDLYLVRYPGNLESDSLFSGFNVKMYNYMQGPSEFSVTGTMINLDDTQFLKEINVPTLFTVGEFDTAGPQLVKGFADQVKDSKYYMIRNAAHITMADAKDENVRVVRNFLLSVDSKN